MNKYYKRILLVIGVLSLVAISASMPFAQIVDRNFYPLVNAFGFSTVYTSAVQTDGKIIIGGLFSNANGYRQSKIARLLPDGKTDESFQPVSANVVTDIKIQSNNQIMVAGTFFSMNGQQRRGIVRLNADGSFDVTFAAEFISSDTSVAKVIIQPDGKYLIAGSFATSFDNQSRNNLARLNSDGSLDLTFQNPFPAQSGDTTELALQSDGRILVNYSVFVNGNWKTYFVRLNSNGSTDSNFPIMEIVGTGHTSGGSADIDAVVIQSDGKIIIGGSFSSVAGTPKNRLARINSNGSLDASFQAQADGAVYVMTLQSDGRLLVGGIFNQINGAARRSFARVNADGSLDSSLSGAFGDPFSAIYTISLQNDGKIISGGDFLKIGDTLRYRVARLNNDGQLDQSFDFVYLATPGLVSVIAPRNDGKFFIGGQFNSVSSSTRRQFALLNGNGTLDESFADVGFGDNFGVYSILPLTNNKVLATGSFFVSAGEQTYSNLARFNANGSVDSTLPPVFNTDNNGYISAVVLRPDGKYLVGGSFAQLGGVPRNKVALINADGTLNSTFQNNVFNDGAYVDKIILQPDGKILIKGSFTQINGVTRNRIARLNADGSLDTAFQNGASGVTNNSVFTPFVYDLALQNDGKIILAGNFETVNGIARRNLARLNTDGTLDSVFVADTAGANSNSVGIVFTVLSRQNGKIVVGGNFVSINGQMVRGLAQLNNDGSVDTFFPIIINSNNSAVYSLALESSGNVLVGGSFGQVNSLPRPGLFRIIFNNRNSFDFDADGKSDVSVFRPDNGAWYLQQSSAGFTGITFGFGTDKLVPSDYDGDGKTDVAVYRNGTWYLQRSSLGFYGVAFGAADDIPVPADYDGDGKADLAVFRPNNGTWYVQGSSVGFYGVAFGQNGDKPVAADYDGDGKADVAVNRSGTWYINRSQLGFFGIQFGDSNDKLVPADYDGDGKADVAVFRPSNGTWYLQQSTNGFTGIAFGLGTDTPVAADYDGDGRADIAVVRNGTWYLNRSTQGFTGIAFGTSTDLAVPSSYVR